MQSNSVTHTAVPVNVTFSYADRAGVVYSLSGGELDGKHVLVSISNVNGMRVTTVHECDDASGSGTYKNTLSQINTDDAEECLLSMGYTISTRHSA